MDDPVQVQDVQGINSTNFPLQVANGFEVTLFSDDVDGARVMALDFLGNLWVSQTSLGQVSLLEIKDGKVASINPIFKNLNRPHGLAFHPENPSLLYIAEEDKISRVTVYSEGTMEKIADLPSGDGHFTRTIEFGRDGRLYVSVGSSCNSCQESDSRRAAISSMRDDGSDFESFATGLRNSVFFAWHPVTGEMWATENGRDRIGDNIPPDEINIVKEGLDYGWPYCFGDNLLDRNFSSNTSCSTYEGSHIDLQAHSAPLGLEFTPSNWPSVYHDDLIVAFHGSWNRTVPTGYKLVHVKLSRNGDFEGVEDFISGWLLEDNTSLGRPVDVLRWQDSLLVTDDKAGVIYKISSQ